MAVNPGAEAPSSSAEGVSRVERRRCKDRGGGAWAGGVPFPTGEGLGREL